MDLEREAGFGEILAEVMRYSPKGNTVNVPSLWVIFHRIHRAKGSINDMLYLKNGVNYAKT